MTSPTQLSEGCTIRRYGKGLRPSRKSVLMYSDYYEEDNDKASDPLILGQRSVSLSALHPGQPLLEPRMAQLETLEAKMASIEVSLSTTPRRKKSGSLGGGRSPACVLPDTLTRTKEIESMRNALRDKENMIQSLKGQLSSSSLSRMCMTSSSTYLRAQNSGHPLSDQDRRAAEDRLQRLKQEMDNKRLAIKNLKMALDRLDITDNIDVRIQQAELEYQLGREELNLLTFLEESRNLQACLDEEEQSRIQGDASTIYSCVAGGKHVSLHAIQLHYDAKSPRFGAGARENLPGLWVDWAAEDSAMEKGDRILEVNGKIVLTKTKEDLLRLLSVTPDPALLVVLRARTAPFTDLREELLSASARAEEAERALDSYRTENVRLTHRISYLEEQVTELLRDRTPSPPVASPNLNNPVQVYQKGQVTALVANLPGLEVGSQSPLIDAKHSLPIKKSQTPNKNNEIPVKKDLGTNGIRNGVPMKPNPPPSKSSVKSVDYNSYDKYNHMQSVRSNSLDIFDIQSPPMKNVKVQKSKQQGMDSNVDLRRAHKKQSRSHQRLECTDKYPDYKSGRSDAEYASESVSGLYRVHKNDTRSVKSLDFDSEPTPTRRTNEHYPHQRNGNCPVHRDYKTEDSNHGRSYIEPEKPPRSSSRSTLFEYGSDTSTFTTNSDYTSITNGKPRPTPPKKPLRLSLHKAASLQCVNQPPESLRKPTKRKHKGEAPPLPVMTGDGSSRAPSRAESCQSALRWPSPAAALHHMRAKNGSAGGPAEKWC